MKQTKRTKWSVVKAVPTVLAALYTILILINCSSCSRSDAPVVNAAEQGDVAKMKSLIASGHSINEVSEIKFGWTPLIAAVYQNNTNAVDYLIKAGADVNKSDKSGLTPLMWAISWGDDGLGLVKELVASGASVQAKDKNGATVLAYAHSNPPKPRIIEFLESAKELNAIPASPVSTNDSR